MTDTTIAPNEIISDDEIEILNAARSIAQLLARRTQNLSHDPRVRNRRVGSDTPGEFELGLLAAHFEDVETAVFQSLNVAHAYGHVPISDDQMHNRRHSVKVSS